MARDAGRAAPEIVPFGRGGPGRRVRPGDRGADPGDAGAHGVRARALAAALALCGGPTGAGCAGEPDLGSLARAVRTHTVRVQDDGTFLPASLTISEGDTVEWIGDGFNFANTDAIARIGVPGSQTKDQLCGAVGGVPGALVAPDPAVHFQGPKRKGISGIHVLGPQGHGFIETSTPNLSATCNDVLDPPPGDPNRDYPTIWTVDSGATRYLLCKRADYVNGQWVQGADPTQGGIAQTLQSVWDNPDVDGVVVRVRWKDFQYYDGTSVVTVWSDIDRELREAVKRGKVLSINFHAGEDTPRFIFTDYDHDPMTPGLQQPPESNVVPVFLKDYSGGGDPLCGGPTEVRHGSPTDPSYLAKIKGLYQLLAEHVKSDARFFQVLGYVKVSGLNLTTGEARLPMRCNDPDASGVPGQCVCNTQRWAQATHGYTPAGLYTFYNEVEHTIFSSFLGEKTLHYMLIENGFPRVLNATNYFRDELHDGDDGIAGTADDLGPDGYDGTEDDGYVGTGFPGLFEQTEEVLGFGRKGRFALPGNPTALPDDLATGKLFLAQHSGLGKLPMDLGLAPCPQSAFHQVLVSGSGKKYHDLYAGSPPTLGAAPSGCPNQWAAREGYRGQLVGYQTVNGVFEPSDVDSSLWNMTSASNAAYYELYEEAAWKVARERGTGPGAAVLTTTGYFPSQGPHLQKNLSEWGRMLHARRKKIATLEAAKYPHLADPFPPSHRHTFDEAIAANAVRDFWYINPGRCMSAPVPQPFGHVRVIGH